jgi:hypothetical protein
MVRYECDRCSQSVHPRDVRTGRVTHLTDSTLAFELCHNCFVVLRSFLRGDAVAAVGTLPDASRATAAHGCATAESGFFGDTSV